METVKVVEVELVDQITDKAHKEIVHQDQEQNRERVSTELAILPEAAQKMIMESCAYSSYFPNPITQDFMETYILSKIEFPTLGAKLAQSMTELNVRIENLFNDAHMYEKADLEAQKLDVEMRKLDRKIKAATDELDKEELEIEKLLKKAEQKNKIVSLNKIKLTAMSRYNEAVGWRGCVEKYMKDMGVESPDQIDFKRIRMDEMSAKIKKWGELAARDQLEMTPSKFNAIEDNQDSFRSGLIDGLIATGQAEKLKKLFGIELPPALTRK